MINEDGKKVLEKLTEHLKNEMQKAIEGSIKASDIANSTLGVDMSIGTDRNAVIDATTLVTPIRPTWGAVPAVEGTVAYRIAIDAMIKSKAEIYKNSTIYRNGIYTTVKWSDGTVTTVKCKEGDECDDTEAFINALANKVFGGRSALKRHVRGHTVDVAEKKRKKAEKKKNVSETPTDTSDSVPAEKILDSKGQELHVGDKVFVEFDDDFLTHLLPPIQSKFEQIRGKIVTVSGVETDGFAAVSYGEKEYFCYIPESTLTKVKTEAPFEEGDYVIVDKPEDANCSPKWIIQMDELVGKPLKIIDVLADREAFGATFNGDNSAYWLYRNDWVRKA